MKKCIFEPCGNKFFANNLCKLHNNHLIRYGEARRMRTQPNEYIEFDDYYQIVIYDRHLKPIDIIVKISKEDLDKCKNIRWQTNGQYVKEATSKHVNYLHRFIIGEIPNGLVVDHINRDKYDNRRQNLRVVTRSENNRNK